MEKIYRVSYSKEAGFYVETREVYSFESVGWPDADGNVHLTEEGWCGEENRAIDAWVEAMHEQADVFRKAADGLELIVNTRTPKQIQDPILLPKLL